MNDDTKKELEVNPVDGISDNFKIDVQTVSNEVNSQPVENAVSQPQIEQVQPVAESTPVVEESLVENAVSQPQVEQVQPVAESTPVVEESLVENDNNVAVTSEDTLITSETVINADINSEVEEEKIEVVTGSIEEVSVNVDSNTFNTLNENEISSESVFNKPVEDNNVTGMKEGQEHLNEKKGFPYFMVVVFVIVVIVAFFIDDIVGFVENYNANKNKTDIQEENKTDLEKEDKVEEDKVKILTLEDIKTGFENSSDIIDFEKANNIEIEITINDSMLTFATTNYLDPTNINTNLKVDYVFSNNVLMATCDLSNTEFGKQMSILLVKEIAKLQGVSSNGLDEYIEENLYTSTLDKGFEFTNSEDGNNLYQIATNIKLDITK